MNQMKRILLLVFINVINNLLIIPLCMGQNLVEGVIEDVFEELSVNNDVENVDWQDELEELVTYRTDPLNLNKATRSQLEQFPFLNDYQIEQLLAYVYFHRELKSIYELQLIKGMDRETINRLFPFICVRPVNNSSFQLKSLLRSIRKYGKHELLTRLDIPFYERKGYQHTYLGPSVYNSVKYSFRYSDRLYAGIVGEKDAGEPFAALHNKKGYDYYSFYLFLQRWGWLKSLAVGNYRLSFGQGLVVSNDFLMGKSLYASSYTSRSKGIRKHSSTDEVNYFRGVAATAMLSECWEVSAFYSHRSMDGTIENGEITSIYKTGLHRSEKEADKKHAFTLQLTGGNVSYQQGRIKLGITGIYYFFDRFYLPELTGYSTYNIHGNRFYNIGVDYAYRFGRFSFQGETAKGKQGWASLNRLCYLFGDDNTLMLLQRFYSYDYWAMFARSFGEGSYVQNEQGYYAGIDVHPFAHWKLFASFDLFSFPWKRYRISKTGSHGMDATLQVTYFPQDSLSMYVKYRYKQKERNVSGSGGSITLPFHHHQLRYRIDYAVNKNFNIRTTLDYNHFYFKNQVREKGYQATQMFRVGLWQTKLAIQMQGSYFHTDGYDSRVYVSEKGLLYTFYTPSFQGEGFRFSAHLRYDLNTHWMFIGKLGGTCYLDRNEIGSGNDLILGNKKLDVQFQLRVKF